MGHSIIARIDMAGLDNDHLLYFARKQATGALPLESAV